MKSTTTSATTRRSFLTSLGALAATPVLARDFGPGAAPVRYPEPDVIVIDPSFKKYKVGNTTIERLHTGMMWAEGTAWSGVGGYLMWSDIPNNVQHRWLADDGHVSVLHHPSGNSNGNTFDREGRQLSCEHGNRRVVRYERDGTLTVIADKFNGKPFNAPNDVVVHPDGGIWFTDPGYGSMGNYEGHKGTLELKEAVYRVDPATGKIEMVTDVLNKPNGLCFSPDYKKLYIADTGDPKNIMIFDVAGEKTLKGGKEFVNMNKGWGKNEQGQFVRGGATALPDPGCSDGIRCDVDGNLWSAAGWVGEGYDGVHVFNPEGAIIGQIKLPEICANLCFGGEKRNRLFMAASRSLYSVYVETQGAHWC